VQDWREARASTFMMLGSKDETGGNQTCTLFKDEAAEVFLPGEAGWKKIEAGTTFEVPANAKFRLRVKTLTDYCCSFFKHS